MSTSKTSRRQFLKSATVLGAGMAATGAAALPVAAQSSRDVETDVVVVGLGLAGLCTALRAAQLGARVIAVEKLPKGFWAPGGSFVISGQLIMQPPKPYRQMVEAVGMENIERAMDWLHDAGVEFVGFTDVAGAEGSTAAPAKDVAGSSFIWKYLQPGGEYDATEYGGKIASLALEQGILDAGGELRYETQAKRLVTDEHGAVTGIVVEDVDGPYTISAGAVMLCTGGFSFNEEMVSKYVASPCRDYVNATQATPGATGDGLLMAQAIGAASSGFGWIYAWMAPAIAATERMHDLSGYLKLDALAAGIIVTDSGERFANEALGRHEYGTKLVKNFVIKQGYYIFDNAVYERLKDTVDELEAFGEEYETTTVYRADTIAELAEMAGISPYLVKTVEEYNAAVEAGEAAMLRVPRTGEPAPVAQGPFYAVPFVMGSNKTYGGLDIDNMGRVLDRNQRPIPGLYASGEVAYASRIPGVPDVPYTIEHISAGGGTGNLEHCLVFGILSAEAAVQDIGIAQ